MPNGATALTGGNPAPWGAQTEVKELQQDRYGLAGAAEWRVNDNLVIKADALWSSYIISEYSTSSGTTTAAASGTPAIGSIACSPASPTAILLRPCWPHATNANYYYGNNGIPGTLQQAVPGASGARLPSCQRRLHFKVDDMGHVVRANLVKRHWVDIQNNLARYWQRQTLVVGGLNFNWTHGDGTPSWTCPIRKPGVTTSGSTSRLHDQWVSSTGFNMEKGTAPYVTASIDPSIPANNTTAYSAGAAPAAEPAGAITAWMRVRN